jgi:hypothetical protein
MVCGWQWRLFERSSRLQPIVRKAIGCTHPQCFDDPRPNRTPASRTGMEKAARLSQTAKRRSKHNCVVRIRDAIKDKIDLQKGTAPEKSASPQPPTNLGEPIICAFESPSTQ